MNSITHLEFFCPLKIISEANNYEPAYIKRYRKRAQQLEITVEMQNALRGRKIQLPCEVRLVRIGPKKLDRSDNLPNGCKGIQDAIAKKLGVDDGDETKVSWVYDQEPGGVRKYAVRVEINSK